MQEKYIYINQVYNKIIYNYAVEEIADIERYYTQIMITCFFFCPNIIAVDRCYHAIAKVATAI